MLVLGVTGQSGAGKGEFCAILNKMGYKSLDTDRTAREVVEKGSECLEILTGHFGKKILYPNGSMNRKKVAEIVFSDKDELEFLTKTTHRYIIEKMKEWLFEREIAGDKIAVIDAPQLFDAGADEYCTFTLAVLAKEETRIERILARDGISREAAKARIDSQEKDGFFKERCDYVVYNDRDLPALRKEAEGIVEELLSKKEYFDDESGFMRFDGLDLAALLQKGKPEKR